MPARSRAWLIFMLLFCWLAVPLAAQAETVDLGVITVKDRNLAESLRQRLLRGEAFETLARGNSLGPTASRGGRLGLLPEERLRSEYRQAIRGLRPGQPSVVVATEDGYNILMRFDQAPLPAVAAAPAARPAPSAPARMPEAATQYRVSQTPAAPQAASPAPVRGALPDTPQMAARLEVMAGLEQLAAKQAKVAEAHFSRALGLNPHEDIATFLQDVAREAATGKSRPEAAAALAEGFMKMFDGEDESALAGFRRARQLDPNMWQAALFEANVVATKGQVGEATAILRGILKENPKLARPHLSLGMIAQDQRQLDQAAGEYRAAVAADPSLAEAHYRLGSLALSEGNYEEAERELKAALGFDPYKEEAFNDLGLVFAATGHLGEAETSYKKALELNPSYAVAHVNLGMVYVSSGRMDQGIDEFNMALSVDPTLAAAHNNLATAYAIRQEWDLAIQHADMAVKLGMPVADVLLQKLAPHRKK